MIVSRDQVTRTNRKRERNKTTNEKKKRGEKRSVNGEKKTRDGEVSARDFRHFSLCYCGRWLVIQSLLPVSATVPLFS